MLSMYILVCVCDVYSSFWWCNRIDSVCITLLLYTTWPIYAMQYYNNDMTLYICKICSLPLWALIMQCSGSCALEWRLDTMYMYLWPEVIFEAKRLFIVGVVIIQSLDVLSIYFVGLFARFYLLLLHIITSTYIGVC